VLLTQLTAEIPQQSYLGGYQLDAEAGMLTTDAEPQPKRALRK
jgi:hypothetical protein